MRRTVVSLLYLYFSRGITIQELEDIHPKLGNDTQDCKDSVRKNLINFHRRWLRGVLEKELIDKYCVYHDKEMKFEDFRKNSPFIKLHKYLSFTKTVQKEITKILAQKKESTKIEDTKKESTKIEDTKKESTRILAPKKESTKIEDTKKESTKIEDTKKESTRIEDTKKESTRIEDTIKESLITKIVKKTAKYSSITLDMPMMTRLGWITDMFDEKELNQLDPSLKVLIFRFYYEVKRFEWDDYINIMARLLVLVKLKDNIASEIKENGRKKRKEVPEFKKFRDAIVDNLHAKLGLVSEGDWKNLYAIIHPEMSSFKDLLTYTEDKVQQEFFRIMGFALDYYGSYFTKKECLNYFTIIKKILSGNIIDQSDFESICQMWYTIYNLQDFRTAFFKIHGRPHSFLNIEKLEALLLSLKYRNYDH